MTMKHQNFLKWKIMTRLMSIKNKYVLQTKREAVKKNDLFLSLFRLAVHVKIKHNVFLFVHHFGSQFYLEWTLSFHIIFFFFFCFLVVCLCFCMYILVHWLIYISFKVIELIFLFVSLLLLFSKGIVRERKTNVNKNTNPIYVFLDLNFAFGRLNVYVEDLCFFFFFSCVYFLFLVSFVFFVYVCVYDRVFCYPRAFVMMMKTKTKNRDKRNLWWKKNKICWLSIELRDFEMWRSHKWRWTSAT